MSTDVPIVASDFLRTDAFKFHVEEEKDVCAAPLLSDSSQPSTPEMDLHHILPQVDIADFSHSQSRPTSINGSASGSAASTPHRLSFQDSSRSPSPYAADQWWSGKYDFAAKIIILGDYGVGKSSLLNTLAGLRDDNSWCRCVASRPNEYVELECVKNEKKLLIRIMDTGGQERFRSLTSSYFRGAHGCMLMFNVTNEESFDNIIGWFNDLGAYAIPDNLSALMVGAITSSNDNNGHHSRSAERRVSAERAFRLAESLNMTYCETNVRDEQMVLWILTRLVNNVLINRVRRQSLAISIMPPLQDKSAKEKSEKKKKWKCCATS